MKVGDSVIFKQRVARHLSCKKDLAWEYESGHIISINESTERASICWLQGYHSRNDCVLFEDIVAIHEKGQPVKTYGSFSGPSRVLKEPEEEGS